MNLHFSPPFIKAGQRFNLQGLIGSADALIIARYFTSHQQNINLLAIICANASDANRLHDEIHYFEPSLKVRVLPDWETLPYDSFSPHQDLVSERLATLYDLSQGNCEILLVPSSTALYQMPPVSYLAGYTFNFSQGDQLDEARLRSQLILAGYDHVKQVVRPGEYCVRGSLIDLFPMGSPLPYRLDLFDDVIDSMRAFDPDNQRSLYPVKNIRLLPGREFPFDEKARAFFRTRWREVFDSSPSRSAIYRDVSQGIPAGGIEYYLPLFFEKTATLFDYLPENSQLVWVGDCEAALARFWEETKQRFQFLANDNERPTLSPEQILQNPNHFFERAKTYARLSCKPQAGDHSIASLLPTVAINRHAPDPLHGLRDFLQQTKNRILLIAESSGRRETISQLLREHHLPAEIVAHYADFLTSTAPFCLTVAPLSAGFSLCHEAISIITETELYGATSRQARRRQEQRSSVDHMVRDLAELKIGDPIVHSQHGIGRYAGLVYLDLGEGETEFLHLQYADAAKLYVPVAQLHLIFRYSGANNENAPLHALGSGQWEKARGRAAKQIRDTAAELLNIYARRALRVGHAFDFSPKDYEQFAERFGFEETPDQAAAINAVISDMTSGKPMDRLVCGDVGFGKTEVALRAAFIAVLGGKQVAMLCPTTLLAEQHFQTFSDRFSPWPVKLAELSRFRTGKETTQAIAGLAAGTVDIVIGTHKLLSGTIDYARLGLLIIDEEHRFGVRQKELLKKLRAEVDILTLTATPIPRTLGMALEGLRDFSVIATAPQKRLAIKTFVRPEDNSTIREAILRELKRGGQIYFLHNEVETIQNRREMLEALIPEARILVAHGQMHERELERVMRDFIGRRANLLLCTTIIETGIDVPNANTIIMHRADRFGLAQLHQLRGRVGRSHHQAYAYLLIRDKESLTKQAVLRLEAIQQMDELGAGFYLAMHDLEIRGAGEVLGDKQSGEIHEIGFQLYTDMLANAVEALKSGKEPDLIGPIASNTEINLHVPAILPASYCGDVQERLSFYKRLSGCRTDEDIDYVHEELIDRFGELPAQAQALVETHRLRLRACSASIIKIDANETLITLRFAAQPTIDTNRIIHLVKENKGATLAGPDRLKIVIDELDLPQRIAYVKNIIHYLINQ